jgi:O-antigen/teichoic acid export membrane protein
MRDGASGTARALLRGALPHLTSRGPLFLASALSAAFSCLCIVISARLLGPREFGLLGTLLAFISIVTLVLRPVLMAAASVASAARVEGQSDRVNGVNGRALTAAIPAAGLAAAVGLVLAPLLQGPLQIHGAAPIVLVGILIVALVYNQVATGSVLGLEHTGTFGLIIAGEPVVRTAVTLALIGPLGVAGALSAYLLSLIVASAAAIVRVGGLGWGMPSRSTRASLFHTGWTSTALVTAVAAAQYLDIVAVRASVDALQAGWYATAGTISGFLFVLGVPICLAAYARFVADRDVGHSSTAALGADAAALLAAGVGATVLAVGLAAPVVELAFGPEFLGAAGLTPVLLAKTSANLLLFLFGSYGLAEGRSRPVLIAAIPVFAPVLLIPALHLTAGTAALLGLGCTAIAATCCLGAALIGARTGRAQAERRAVS